MRRTLVMLAGSAGPAVPALTELQSNAQAHEYRAHEYRHHVARYEHRDDDDRDHAAKRATPANI
jgi:hypothetical protein